MCVGKCVQDEEELKVVAYTSPCIHLSDYATILESLGSCGFSQLGFVKEYVCNTHRVHDRFYELAS